MLIEKNKYEIATPKARRLQVGNYNSLKKYLRYVEGQFRKENLLAKVLGITTRIMNKEKVDVYEIEMLDKKRTEIVLKAEKYCRTIKTGQVPYAPEEVQKHGKMYFLWNLVVRKLLKR